MRRNSKEASLSPVAGWDDDGISSSEADWRLYAYSASEVMSSGESHTVGRE
jgi:hypothetical protein